MHIAHPPFLPTPLFLLGAGARPALANEPRALASEARATPHAFQVALRAHSPTLSSFPCQASRTHTHTQTQTQTKTQTDTGTGTDTQNTCALAYIIAY